MDTLKTEDYYRELCANTRSTDEISFKLLGAVPLISGTALTALFAAKDQLKLPTKAIILVALFGAAVTLGLSRWERRNTQICSSSMARAADVESDMLAARHHVDPDRVRAALAAERAELDTVPRRQRVRRAAELREWTESDLGLTKGAVRAVPWSTGGASLHVPRRLREGRGDAVDLRERARCVAGCDPGCPAHRSLTTDPRPRRSRSLLAGGTGEALSRGASGQ